MQRITNITCSLNLGLIYSVEYNYSKENGVTMTIFFVNESGEYTKPQLIPMQKVFITLGGMTISLYPIRYRLSKASGRRVISVDFVDESFQLDHYYVVLTGKGCGKNIYQLGNTVDTRVLAAKLASSLDPSAEQVQQFTQFQDIEYSFNDFLNVLRQKFNVQILTSFDASVTQSFVGTFREVLKEWVDFYNFAFFFENGILKIFNPTTMFITLPTQPIDAIEYEIEEDITNTYGKTVFNYIELEGGEFELNDVINTTNTTQGNAPTAPLSNPSGPTLTSTATLYPVGYEINLPQTSVDMNQVVASMYGPAFWFLYNYYNGSAEAQCGFKKISNSDAPNLTNSIVNNGLSIAYVNQQVFNDKYDFYNTYGRKIAGRYYISPRRQNIDIDQTYSWLFQFQDFSLSPNMLLPGSNAAPIKYLVSPNIDDSNYIQETVINQYYSGILYKGSRMYYVDESVRDLSAMTLDSVKASLAEGLFEKIFKGASSSENLDYGELAGGNYVAYDSTITIPQDISQYFTTLDKYYSLFKYSKDNIDLYGTSTQNFISAKEQQTATQNNPLTLPDGTIVPNLSLLSTLSNGNQNVNNNGNNTSVNNGPTVIGNTAIIREKKEGKYKIYYDKYSQCNSASTIDSYYGYKFEGKAISSDNPINFSLIKPSKNVYTINRDMGYINSLVNNPFLAMLAQPRTFTTKKVIFTLNYFYNIPSNYLTQGFVGMSMNIDSQGVRATYTFSNEPLINPLPEKLYMQYQQMIKNSWKRQYNPSKVIS